MAKRNIDLDFSAKGLSELNAEMRSLRKHVYDNRRAMNDFSSSTSKLEKAFSSLVKASVAVAGFGGLGKNLANYNKQLFDLSKNARVSGQSIGDLRRAMDDVHKSTQLSLKDTAAFFRTMQQQQRGARMSAQATAALAKTLTQEYGPALEDIKEGMDDLLALQQKEINVLRKVNKGFDAGELSAYSAVLLTIHGASQKQVETLNRVAMAHKLKGRYQTEDQKKAIALKTAMEGLEKAGSDLLIKVAQPLSEIMTSLATGLGGVVNKIAELSKYKWFTQLVVGGAAVTAGAAGAAALYHGGRAALQTGRAAMSGLGRAKEAIFGTTARPTLKVPGKGGRGGGAGLGSLGAPLGTATDPLYVINVGAGGGMMAGGRGGKGARAGGRGRWRTGPMRGQRYGAPRLGAGGGLGGFGRAAGFMGKASPWAIIGGLAAEYGGGALKESGHERLGGAVSAGGNILSSAGTGAMLGSMLGPIGTVVGTIAGAGYGLVQSWDDIKTAVMGTSEAEKKAKAATEKKAKADEEAAKKAEEFAAKMGLSVKDKEWLVAKKTQENIATSAATQLASQRGLTGTARQRFIETGAQEIQEGRAGGELSSIYQTMSADRGQVAAAQSAAVREFGKTVEGVDLGGAREIFDLDNVQKTNVLISNIAGDIEKTKLYSTQIVSANEKLATLQANLYQDFKGAQKIQEANIPILQQQYDQVARMAELMRKIADGSSLTKKERSELTAELAKQGKSDTEINDLLNDRLGIVAAVKKAEGDLADIKQQQVGMILQGIAEREKEADLAGGQVSVLKAQLDVVKAQYLGMGPYLDKVFEVDAALESQKNTYDDIIQSLLQVQKTRQLTTAETKKLYSLQVQSANIERERLEITKNLREGYLDAIQAFTNVEGAFSKFIITREKGFGEAIRKGMGAAGYGVGAAGGVGSEEALIKYGTGGSMQFRNKAEQQRIMRAYETYSPFQPGAVGGAELAKEAGAQDILAGQAIARATGAPGSTVGALTAGEYKNRVAGAGGHDEVAPGFMPVKNEMQALNQNMADYVAEGIKKAGGGIAGGGKGAEGIKEEIKKGSQEQAKAVKESTEKKIAAENAALSRAQADDRQKIGQKTARQQEMDRVIDEQTAKYKTLDKWLKATTISRSARGYRAGVGIGRPVRAGIPGGEGVGGAVAAAPGAGGPKNLADAIALAEKNARMGRAPAEPDVSREEILREMRYAEESQGGLGPKDTVAEMRRRALKRRKKDELDEIRRSAAAAEGGGGGGGDNLIGILRGAGQGASERQHKEQLAAQEKNTKATVAGAQGTQKSVEDMHDTYQESLKEEERAKQNQNLVRGGDGGISLPGEGGGGGLGGYGRRRVETGFTSLEKAVLGGVSGGFGFSFASGGWVGGRGGTDSQVARVTPGEFVVNPRSARANAGLLESINAPRFASGGFVGPSPAVAMGGAGGFSPRIGINVRGDSVNAIMKSVTGQLQKRLNDMMAPQGTSSRYFDIPQSG